MAAVLEEDGDRRERLIGLTVGLFGELGDEHPADDALQAAPRRRSLPIIDR